MFKLINKQMMIVVYLVTSLGAVAGERDAYFAKECAKTFGKGTHIIAEQKKVERYSYWPIFRWNNNARFSSYAWCKGRSTLDCIIEQPEGVGTVESRDLIRSRSEPEVIIVEVEWKEPWGELVKTRISCAIRTNGQEVERHDLFAKLTLMNGHLTR